MSSIKSITFLQILNVAGFIGMIAVNAFADILRFNGKSTGEISDEYPTLFTPAGITFAIWGVIYLLLLVFTIYQARDLFIRKKTTFTIHERISFLYFLTCCFNSFWIFAWHYEMTFISLLDIILLLSALIAIYMRLGIGLKPAPIGEKLCVHLPFSIYLGWISVAVIANAAVLLTKINWDRFGIDELYLAIALIIIAALLALVMITWRNDFFYSLVILWAFTGIIIKHSKHFTDVSQNIIMTAAVCIVIIALGMMSRFRKWLNYLGRSA